MGFNKFISKLFGNKAQRDLGEINPIVKRIQEAYPAIEQLTNDELRAKTKELEKEISEYVSEEKAEIERLKAGMEEIELDQREGVWNQVDKLEKEITDKYEKILNELLPVAFSIMKDTARRFTQNSEVVVTATQFDRDLAATHDFVRVEGDKAIYSNHWVAGGNEITWDMIHYDVQLLEGGASPREDRGDGNGRRENTGGNAPSIPDSAYPRGCARGNRERLLGKRDSEGWVPCICSTGSRWIVSISMNPTRGATQAYNADVTFGTNNEFGFDYLRDNMAISPKDLVQRKHNFAIVDEVDSVLIDDARTPLIISGPVPKGDDQLYDQFRPRVEVIVKAQREMTTRLLADARTKMASEDPKEQEEGALLLFRSYKGMPKYKPLIKFLSEQGVRAAMLKTEAFYMQEQMRNMHVVTDPLYFVIDEKQHSIELTDKGIDLLTGRSDDPEFFILPDIGSQLSELEGSDLPDEEKAAKKDELLQNYAIKSERVHTINQLLKAYALFDKDDEYVVIDNKVKIVDEQTGRVMEGRRYSDGLHQAIEAKERVKVEAATQTFATVTLQNFFRMYSKLAGMTGTAETEAGEFWDIYKLDVVVIPTNRPIIRDDQNDRIYKTKREKYTAVIEEIVELIGNGRPVLVGTTSVEISELLSRMLTLRKIQHNVLNAKLHQREAEIVATAGQPGVVTIATNMAGRGTDIKLTPKCESWRTRDHRYRATRVETWTS